MKKNDGYIYLVSMAIITFMFLLMFSSGALGTGFIMLMTILIGFFFIVFFIFGTYEKRRLKNLMKPENYHEAIVLEIIEDNTKSYTNEMNNELVYAHYVICNIIIDGEPYMYKSKSSFEIKNDIEYIGKEIPIYINPNNRDDYYLDVDAVLW